MSEARPAATRLAAIYARVSTDRQRDEGTVESQVSELRELASDRGLLVAEEFVFCDEGFSGAVLARPALERLRDRAAEGAFEVLLCHSADGLARGGAAAPVPGHDRRVRARPDRRAHAPWAPAPRPAGISGRARRRPLRLPLRAQVRVRRRLPRDRRGR